MSPRSRSRETRSRSNEKVRRRVVETFKGGVLLLHAAKVLKDEEGGVVKKTKTEETWQGADHC